MDEPGREKILTAETAVLCDAAEGTSTIWHGFDPQRAAIVLVDLINWQAAPDGALVKGIRASGRDEKADYLISRCADVLLPNLHQLIPAARQAGIQIVHARLASRHPDYMDIVPALRELARSAGAQDGTHACAPLPEVGYRPSDLSIIKPGSGAFTGSNLDILLRRLGIDTIFYTGVVTNACVFLSAATGFDLGYRQYLITDCTAALSDDDQAYAERFIGSYIAEPVTADETSKVFQRFLDARASSLD